MSVLTSTGPIEFTISAENSNYIDLANTFLYVRASVTAADGTDLEEDVEISPECNFLHTMWSQIDVYLNGSLVTQSNNNYPYRAYIENLLSFGQDANHHNFLLSCGIGIQLVNLIQEAMPTQATLYAKHWLHKAAKLI